MSSITLRNITKQFGRTSAVDGIDLTIPSGDLFFLLGPSGCGKTTLLRMIAGFIEPTAGQVVFGEKDVTALPPNKRNTGMVFQSYALWPHMSVAENVAYGLKIRKLDKPARDRKVAKALESVRMAEYADRKPNQLSGGQQQRVALARALVIEPTVLLLDEPLSNLDAKLRLEMRSEIRRLCTETGITTVYVTHDQKEALSMADGVAVLKDGAVQQVGPPRELYERPRSRFVADFLGETNFIAGTIAGGASGNGSITIETPAGQLISRTASDSSAPDAGSAITCSVRPEAVRIVDTPAAENAMTGTRVETIYLGEVAQHIVQMPGGNRIKAYELNPRHFGEPGDAMHLTVAAEDIIVLPDT